VRLGTHKEEKPFFAYVALTQPHLPTPMGTPDPYTPQK
jgi:hypothetical protein